jgi:SAM-dependent methyltransferase
MGIAYYEANAQAYFDGTVGMEMASIRARFLDHLSASSHILDAGCGSGRDTLAFLKAGHRVTALDGSAEMARLASMHCGQSVLAMEFKDLNFTSAFDGIWACGSLVHMSEDELLASLGSLARALKPSGTFFFCLKKGARDQSKVDSVTGRFFNRHDIGSIAPLVEGLGLGIKEHWDSDSQREPGSQWLNVICNHAD